MIIYAFVILTLPGLWESREISLQSVPTPSYVTNKNQELVRTQNELTDSSMDYRTYEETSRCPPDLPAENVQWRLGNNLIVSYLPHVEPGDCSPPNQCRISTTVHRQLFLQEGDSLKIMLQNPSGFSQLQTTTTEDPDPENLMEANISMALESEEADLTTESTVTPETKTSPLTIWRVTENEWSSCSTREGGQIAHSDDRGIVNVGAEYLMTGTTYFVGRSSWSSSECFKLKAVVRRAECGEGSICSGKGICHANSTMVEYQCSCCDGYKGLHCEEKDACSAKPCKNSGICIDIEEGHNAQTFQCICVYGFKGSKCEDEISLCSSAPCNNGGTCHGNHSSYQCECLPGYSGSLCSERNESALAILRETEKLKGSCSDGECVHGVCIQTSTIDFRCFCQPGYGGSRCDVEYDECFSSPCVNGATCLDGVGSFQCVCGPGYTGKTCDTKIDLCTKDSCPGDRICVDRGNSFTCECLTGITSDDCSQDEQLCSPNPCRHGGSCYIIPETVMFYCACRPGFTGQTCQGILHHRQSDSRESYESPDRKDASILESVNNYQDLEPVKAIEPRNHLLGHARHHWKSIYTAGATLTCAFIIFFLVVSVWHCRTAGYSPRCLWLSRSRSSPSFKRMHLASICEKRRKARLGALRLDNDPDGSSVPMTPQHHSESVYCNMDVCDSQDAPLMK